MAAILGTPLATEQRYTNGVSAVSAPISVAPKLADNYTLPSTLVDEARTYFWITRRCYVKTQHRIQKDDLYSLYSSFCASEVIMPLCPEAFSKLIFLAYPSVTTSRYCHNSRAYYCYQDLQYNENGRCTLAPGSEDGPRISETQLQQAMEDVVCLWLSKLLARSFNSLTDVAYYALQNISSKSTASLTLVLALLSTRTLPSAPTNGTSMTIKEKLQMREREMNRRRDGAAHLLALRNEDIPTGNGNIQTMRSPELLPSISIQTSGLLRERCEKTSKRDHPPTIPPIPSHNIPQGSAKRHIQTISCDNGLDMNRRHADDLTRLLTPTYDLTSDDSQSQTAEGWGTLENMLKLNRAKSLSGAAIKTAESISLENGCLANLTSTVERVRQQQQQSDSQQQQVVTPHLNGHGSSLPAEQLLLQAANQVTPQSSQQASPMTRQMADTATPEQRSVAFNRCMQALAPAPQPKLRHNSDLTSTCSGSNGMTFVFDPNTPNDPFRGKTVTQVLSHLRGGVPTNTSPPPRFERKQQQFIRPAGSTVVKLSNGQQYLMIPSSVAIQQPSVVYANGLTYRVQARPPLRPHIPSASQSSTLQPNMCPTTREQMLEKAAPMTSYGLEDSGCGFLVPPSPCSSEVSQILGQQNLEPPQHRSNSEPDYLPSEPPPAKRALFCLSTILANPRDKAKEPSDPG